MSLSDLILSILAIPAAASCLYLALLTVLSAAPRPRPASSRQLRFSIVVPAHDEAPVIERTVASLRRLDWPPERFRILVVADNCTDNTAALARAAGAQVLERHDTELRGKGYALAHAFRHCLDEDWTQAVAVVDADTEVSANLLEAFACRIERGEGAVQAHYGILNPWTSWRTQLLTIAMAAFHIVRSRARERLGLSCGIRGNGWCLARAQLQRVPYAAFSLAEDLEYGIALGLAGSRVAYADEASVNGEMVSSAQVAGKQRQRWEGGRFALIRTSTWPLLRAAAVHRSAVCLELALDLLLLPLSYVALSVLLLLVAALLLAGHSALGGAWIALALGCCAALVLHVLRGWQLSGLGARGLWTLARVPGFLLWKLLLLRRAKPQGWVRTEREKP
jgi:cellulose synthase/poly-beta-1,6-N-acetylglucosamine synthase-like glycosyltransferase